MTAKAYPVLARAVEEGVRYGYRRAHKHVEKPDETQMCDAIEQAVLDAVCEWFSFEESEDAS
jgi:hypothetical protein